MAHEALKLHLLAFWRDYCAQENKPDLTVPECHHMNNDISLEHKMVAQRLALLWDTFSVQPFDAAHVQPATENPQTQERII